MWIPVYFFFFMSTNSSFSFSLSLCLSVYLRVSIYPSVYVLIYLSIYISIHAHISKHTCHYLLQLNSQYRNTFYLRSLTYLTNSNIASSCLQNPFRTFIQNFERNQESGGLGAKRLKKRKKLNEGEIKRKCEIILKRSRLRTGGHPGEDAKEKGKEVREENGGGWRTKNTKIE